MTIKYKAVKNFVNGKPDKSMGWTKKEEPFDMNRWWQLVEFKNQGYIKNLRAE